MVRRSNDYGGGKPALPFEVVIDRPPRDETYDFEVG